MIIQTNFVKGKMNKSADERLVPMGEYVDALNIRLGSTETTEIGAVENSKGNTSLTVIEYLGSPLSESAKCIGAYEDGMEETIYWFVSDPDNPSSASGKVDMILSYNANTGSLQYHVVSETILNFDQKYLITGVNKISDFLYFTDDLNPPRFINVTRNYNTDVAASNPLVEDDISVILKPPGYDLDPSTTNSLGAPHVELLIINGQENFMEDRFLSFAYRYRYLDGGYSAISLFTTPAFQPKAFRFNYENFQNDSMVNRFNAANITFSTGSRRVIEIQLLMKDTVSNVVNIVKRFSKKTMGLSDDSFYTHQFSNSEIYSVLPSDELSRLYDGVPLLAKAQTIQGNRLMYGNYVDQFNMQRTEDGPDIDFQFDLEKNIETIGGKSFATPTTAVGSYAIDPTDTPRLMVDGVLTFDLSVITANSTIIPAGTQLNFQFSINNSFQSNNGGPQIPPSPFLIESPFTIAFSFSCPVTYTSIQDLTNSNEFKDAIGTFANIQTIIPTNNSENGQTLTDKFNASIPTSVGSTSLQFVNSAITGTCPNPIGTFPPTISVCTQQPIIMTPSATGFSIQLPAVQYYYDDGSGGDISIQYNYFTFNAAACYGSYLLTDDTKSLHSNRDYQVGVVYLDEYGRASTVQVSDNNTIYFPPQTSTTKNSIKVNMHNVAPYWAKYYKFVCKPSKGVYNTIWSTQFYQQGENPHPDTPEAFLSDPSSYWFKLEGDSQNLVSVGDVLTVKMDASGPVNSLQKVEVLDKQAVISDQITTGSLAGLYIKLKPSGWSVDTGNLSNINQSETRQGTADSGCTSAAITNISLNEPNSFTPMSIPAGTSIRIRVHNSRGGGAGKCNDCAVIFDRTYISTTDYANFHDWAIGDNLEGSMIDGNCDLIDDMSIHFDPNLLSQVPNTCFNAKIYVKQEATGQMFLCNNGSIPGCWDFWPFDGEKATNRLEVQIIRSTGLFCFETETAATDESLYFDASNLLEVYEDPGTGFKYHKAKRVFDPGTNTESIADGSVDQDQVTPLTTILDFSNCYTFGNGCESFRIEDRIDAKSFNLGERVLAVSNTDFQEADRFASMTYSGVFSDASNVNNLNEFNLGLANFKDLETGFGPIMKMHSRETDILVLQEDRISYVLTSKNVITDSTGGGNIVSVPEVLGQQIARVEEFGISFNPESFVSWGSSMFFTDTKRSAVLMLKGSRAGSDQLVEISSFGMRSFFRDQFNAQVSTQKLGGYDPYMDEYVLSTNNDPVPIEIPKLPCGQRVMQRDSNQILTYDVDLGNVIGDVVTTYNVTSGQININILWNGSNYLSGNVSSSGTFVFTKTAGTPSTATITITPVDSASYDITTACPEEDTLTIIQVVVNTNNYDGQSIHAQYEWNDGTTFGPLLSNAITLSASQPAFYFQQSGIRSLGIYPYGGANIILKAHKIGSDDFVFNPLLHRFKILSSNTLYTSSASDINTLLGAASNITPITNPSTNIYQAEQSSFSIPLANQYLYLIWDFRHVIQNDLCYSAASLQEVCCDCREQCSTAYFTPVQFTSTDACALDTNTFGSNEYSFIGTALIPQLGDTVFTTLNCSGTSYPTEGYYVVDPSQPSGASPKNWIEIGADGVVINSGTC